MVDVHCEVLHYTSRYVPNMFSFTTSYTYISQTNSKVLRKIQAVSGLLGMVSPREKTCLLHSVVGRFHTGDTIRVVQPAVIIFQAPWKLEDNRSCGLRFTYDVHRGKSLGTLTLRVCWRTQVYRDEIGFDEAHFKY